MIGTMAGVVDKVFDLAKYQKSGPGWDVGKLLQVSPFVKMYNSPDFSVRSRQPVGTLQRYL